MYIFLSYNTNELLYFGYSPNLHYDGAGPDAYFWVGNGSEPNIMGVKVRKIKSKPL